MRESPYFRKQIELAKESIKTGKGNPKEIAKSSTTDQEVFEIQKEKQMLMERLYSELEQIDKNEEISKEGRPTAKYDKDNEKFIIGQGSKSPQFATLGDLITDASWGLEYNLDETTPRNFKKKYCLETIRQKIASLYDQQLISRRMVRSGTTPGEKEAYRAIQRMTEAEFERSSGLIFEKVLKNLLFQLQHDLPDWDIRVEDTNIVKDVEYKIDFVIAVKKHRRGAQIIEMDPEKIDKPLVLGIQFTLLPSSASETKHLSRELRDRFTKKYQQKVNYLNITKTNIKKLYLDDVLLISMPTDAREITNKYKIWKQLGKPVGGPERLYDTHTKITILKTLLQKMGIDNILKNQEGRLKDYYKSKLAP